MSDPFSYSNSFVLDKAHFQECFDQSVTIDHSIKAYRKALAFILIGLCALLFTEFDRYIASFVVGLGVVEALSVKYQKAWWVTRQMLGRSSNNQVTLSIDDEGVTTQSALVDFTLKWQDITKIERTTLGVILELPKQKHYISASVISESALNFIIAKSPI